MTQDSAISLDITIDRIGGQQNFPRAFQTKRTVSTTGHDYVAVDSRDNARLYIQLIFRAWFPIRDGEFLSCDVTLEEMNGYPIGRRPALVYNGAHDTPTYTSFLHESGLFVLGLRRNDRGYQNPPGA